MDILYEEYLTPEEREDKIQNLMQERADLIRNFLIECVEAKDEIATVDLEIKLLKENGTYDDYFEGLMNINESIEEFIAPHEEIFAEGKIADFFKNIRNKANRQIKTDKALGKAAKIGAAAAGGFGALTAATGVSAAAAATMLGIGALQGAAVLPIVLIAMKIKPSSKAQVSKSSLDFLDDLLDIGNVGSVKNICADIKACEGGDIHQHFPVINLNDLNKLKKVKDNMSKLKFETSGDMETLNKHGSYNSYLKLANNVAGPIDDAIEKYDKEHDKWEKDGYHYKANHKQNVDEAVNILKSYRLKLRSVMTYIVGQCQKFENSRV